MKRFAQLLLLSVVAVGVIAPAFAEGPSDSAKAQDKLMAQRAARVDAIRKLAEQINGLQIDSKTTVKDFVAESDDIRAAMSSFLNGMKEKDVKFNEDGTCTVTMDVTIETVTTTLKEIRDRYYKGDKFKATDFTQITQNVERKVLTASGSGAPRQEWSEGPAAPAVEGKSFDSSIDYMGARARKYWLANVKPAGRLMAVRAARIDAMRRLVERIAGSQINSETIVRDFVTERDDIQALSSALLTGAREVSIRYHDSEPVVEVEMAVTLETVTTAIRKMEDVRVKGDKVKMKEFEDRIEKIDRKDISETGMGVVRDDLMREAAPPAVMETVKEVAKWPPVLSETGSAAIDTENKDQAQAKLMAMRGAELDARRKLAERIDGLEVRSKTTVKDFVAQKDEIRTALMTFQQGAYVVESSKKVNKDGTVEVTVEIDPEPLWDIVMHYSSTTTEKQENTEE